MTGLTFGSVCSGIEAASVAFNPLGWSASWFAEIEPFPSAVLAHHYPEVPNLGDMTTLARRVLAGEAEAPDVLCGGTPCQAFSVAGLRGSLADVRGNLTMKFVELSDAIDLVRAKRGDQPSIVFWENVPGVLSTRDNAFGCFLGALSGESSALEPPGGRWSNAGAVYGPTRAIAWRTLDAQYFGLAQRRRRVFVVASARDGFDPATVLFEWDGVRRDTAPSREAGENAAGATALSVALRGRDGGGTAELGDDVGGCLLASSGGGDKPHVLCMAPGQGGAEIASERRATLTCNHEAPIIPFDTTQITSAANYSNPCHPLAAGAHPPAIAFSCKDHGADAGAISPTLRAMNHAGSHANAGGQVAVCITGDITHTLKAEGFDASEDGTGRWQPIIAFNARQDPDVWQERVGPLDTDGGTQAVQQSSAVRRLTPSECEKLQGFPVGYTAIPWRTWQEARRKGSSYEGLLNSRGMTLRGPSIEECPDGPRYKSLGNSWAVPCVAWIGKRIDATLKRATP